MARPKTSQVDRRPARWPGLGTVAPAAVIVAVVTAAYLTSFAGVFVFDDQRAIVDNPHARQLWPLSQALKGPHLSTVRDRPTVSLSIAVNYALGGLQPWGYHAMNLLIHLIAALALFGIVRRTLQTKPLRARFGQAATPLGLIIALIWAVHPLQTQSVTYIVQRAESLMGMFFLLTLYCAMRGFAAAPAEPGDGQRARLRTPSPSEGEGSGEGGAHNHSVASTPHPASPLQGRGVRNPSLRRAAWFTAAVACCAAGMGAKEVMFAAPLVVWVYDRCFVSGTWLKSVRRHWMLYAPMLATLWIQHVRLSIAWSRLVVMLGSAPSSGAAQPGGPPAFIRIPVAAPIDYLLSQLGVIVHYLRLAFWPQGLCFDYRWPVAHGVSAIAPGAVIVAVLLGATVWALWRRKPAGFLGAWFFLILAPTSSLMPLPDLLVEHRMYLPLAAVVVAVVLGAFTLWTRWRQTRTQQPAHPANAANAAHPAQRWLRAAPVAMVVVIVAALGVTTAQRNRVYHSELSVWRDVVDKRPNNPRGQLSLADTCMSLGQTDQAIDHYRRALQLTPDNADAHMGLGTALVLSGHVDDAVAHFQRAVELRPNSVDAHINLGAALSHTSRPAEAVQHYEKALTLRQDDAATHRDLAAALSLLGRTDDAVAHYRRAAALQPDDAVTHAALAMLLVQQGHPAEAAEHLNRAALLDPDNAEVHNNLGALLAQQGRLDEAGKQFQIALKIDPNHRGARQNLDSVIAALHVRLATLLGQQGKAAQAVAELRDVLSVRPDNGRALTALAWMLATSADEQVRDGAEALRLAKRACQVQAGQAPAAYIAAVDALAAAYAATARFDDAVANAQRAVDLAAAAGLTDAEADYRARLDLYRQNQPYRQSAKGDTTGSANP